ncbi:MAG: hypothetical protein M3Q99_07065 [Acidobacteriota bacterium]|nr:hypothetical protein [Acidobacteriota bacterium]
MKIEQANRRRHFIILILKTVWSRDDELCWQIANTNLNNITKPSAIPKNRERTARFVL